MKLPLFITSCLFIFSILPAHAQSAVPSTEAGFQEWLLEFKHEAEKSGISKQTLEAAFKGVHLNKKVLESDRRQPEFTRTFFDYFNRAVSQQRIKTGQRRYEQHRALLDQVTKKYGVPGRVLVAFWGMETNYGSYTGNTYIIESLATLAYHPRRSDFFSKQLLNALQIIDQGHVTTTQMKGSWAGAMGQCQFMPSNYLTYAVDGDGDGKINLWDSLPDVFHSAGNFLQHLGWQKEQSWGREVTLPVDFNYALADGKTLRSLPEWHSLGIQQANGHELASLEDMPAKLLLPSGYQGPAFLVYDNFAVMKRWNNSDKYAIAVGHLADRIVGKPALTKQQPRDDQALSKAQTKQIQQHLNQLGYPAGKADGVSGNKTRSALRAFQVQQNLPADGHPSVRMLHLLSEANRPSP